MARRILIGVLFLASLSIPVALSSLGLAQSGARDYVPHLADIMSRVQARHDKVWYAGKAANWELAGYELRQLKGGLLDAAMLYAGIPVSNVTTMATPLQSVEEAIAARDVKRFSKTFAQFTAGCNGCHVSMERSFIVVRIPGGKQSAGDQGRP